MDRGGSYDLIVVGAGLAGLAAALAAGQFGLRTLVLEKASKIGGGSATSLGALWIGDSHIADAAGFRDSRTEVRNYMRFVGGDQVDDARLEAYIGQAPEAVLFFERCGVRFRVVDGLVDNYQGIAPGAAATGRYLEAELISAGPLADSLYLQSSVPPHMTLQELIAWGGVANPNGWDQELIEQRRRAGLYGRGAGLIAHFLAQARTRGVTTRTSAAVASAGSSALALLQPLDLIRELVDLGRHAGERADHLLDSLVCLRSRLEDAAAVELKFFGLYLLDLSLLLSVLEFLALLVLVLHFLGFLAFLGILPLDSAVEVVLLPILAVPEILTCATDLAEKSGEVAHRETTERSVRLKPDFRTVCLGDKGLLAGLAGFGGHLVFLLG
jgi:hypothetical protein